MIGNKTVGGRGEKQLIRLGVYVLHTQQVKQSLDPAPQLLHLQLQHWHCCGIVCFWAEEIFLNAQGYLWCCM
jgi:hypothetical protein